MAKQGKTGPERKHLARVATMPCLVCGAWPEVHHVTAYSDRIGRVTKSHKRVVPLCSADHRTGPNAVHRISHRGFYDLHGIDLMAVAEKLWNETNG